MVSSHQHAPKPGTSMELTRNRIFLDTVDCLQAMFLNLIAYVGQAG